MTSLNAFTQPEPSKILFLGDSLTEGYGIQRENAYPALVEATLKSRGYSVEAINAGISGSTTSSALGRLRWHIKVKPNILVLALGANDALRGIPIEQVRKNLEDTLSLAKEQNLPVLFIGMKAPPNYGNAYTTRFENMFVELAKQYKVASLPFLLDRVAGDPALNLADGLHPNEKGHRVMAESVSKALEPFLQKKS